MDKNLKVKISKDITKKEFLDKMEKLFNDLKLPTTEREKEQLNQENIKLRGQNYILKHNMGIKHNKDEIEDEVDCRLLEEYINDNILLRREIIKCDMHIGKIEDLLSKLKEDLHVPKEVRDIIAQYFNITQREGQNDKI